MAGHRANGIAFDKVKAAEKFQPVEWEDRAGMRELLVSG